MAAPIDFYFDFSSPYGYPRVAEDRCAGGEARPDRRLASGAARRDLQGDGDGAAHDDPAQGRLLEARLRAERALPRHRDFRMPSKFPIATQAPARIVLWLKARDPALARSRREGAVPRVLPRRHRHLRSGRRRRGRGDGGRRRERPRARRSTIRRSRTSSSARSSRRWRAASSARRIVVVDGEPFWGLDRFDQIERWLATGGF